MKNYSIRQLSTVGIAANFVACLLLYFLMDAPTIVDIEHILYLFLLTLILVIFVNTSGHVGYPLVMVLVAYVFLKYCLSVPFLMLLPQFGSDWLIERNSMFTSDHYRRSLSYAVLGTLIAGVGLLAGSRHLLKNKLVDRARLFSAERPIDINIKALLIYVTVLIAIHLYFNPVTGAGYDDENELNWLRIFMRQTVVRSLIVAIIVFQWQWLTKGEKASLLISLVMMVCFSIIEGGRSYIYILCMILAFTCLVRYGNFTLSKRFLSYGMVAVIVSVILYPLATVMRWVGRYYPGGGLFAIDPIKEGFNEFYLGEKNVFASFLLNILNRFTEPDVPMRIMNDMQLIPVGDLLSVGSMMKRIINGLVPGDLFPDIMPPQYLFDHIYIGSFVGFNAQEWGIWEYFYVMFGYGGGLMCLFLVMVAAGVLWRTVLLGRSWVKHFLVVVFIYFFWMFLLNYDPAYVLNSAMIELIVFVFVLQILRVMSLGMNLLSQSFSIAVKGSAT